MNGSDRETSCDENSNLLGMVETEEDLLLNGILSLSSKSFAFLEPSDNVEKLESSYKRSLADEAQALQCFRLGITCLCCFVQDNFCGPPEDREFLPAFLVGTDAASTIRNVHLAIDGEAAYQGCRNPCLLLVAKWTFLDSGEPFASKFSTVPFWALRTVRIWQHLFPRRQNKLASLFSSFFADNIGFRLDSFSKNVKALLLIELVEVCSYYYRFEDAQAALVNSMELMQFSVRVMGVLGRRTRFQTFDCAQLVLRVERDGQAEDDFTGTEPQGSNTVPATLPLDDDTLLEELCLAEKETFQEGPLNALEQCALLAGVAYARRSGPSSTILREELKLYLEKVIEQRSNWAAQTAALYHRCQMERKERRKVERAMKQISDSVDKFYDSSVSVCSRFRYVFTSCLPPIWVRETCLADILFSMGCSSEALQMFMRLKAWDSVIECYKRLGRLAKAESVIRSLLSEEETPEMYCYLGEITGDALCFVKAWKLSDERYARAQRGLGNLLLNQGKYDEAMVAFRKALTLQPMDLESSFSRGFCAMKMKRYALAVRCYQRCVQIEPDYAEAWSNLAASLMQMGEYDKAYRVLQDALRCKYEDLKIWENFVRAALEAHRLKDALMGVNHILDSGGDFSDYSFTCYFVYTCLEKANANNSTVEGIDEQLKSLLARLTSKYPNDVKLWKAYATTCEHFSKNRELVFWEKYVSICDRIMTLERRNGQWHLNESSMEEMLRWSLKSVEAKSRLAELLEPHSTRRTQLLLSARLLANEVLGKVEKTTGFDVLQGDCKQLLLLLKQAEAALGPN